MIVEKGAATYVYFPATHGLPHDATAMASNYFGKTHTSTKVLAHEAGRYLVKKAEGGTIR